MLAHHGLIAVGSAAGLMVTVLQFNWMETFATMAEKPAEVVLQFAFLMLLGWVLIKNERSRKQHEELETERHTAMLDTLKTHRQSTDAGAAVVASLQAHMLYREMEDLASSPDAKLRAVQEKQHALQQHMSHISRVLGDSAVRGRAEPPATG